MKIAVCISGQPRNVDRGIKNIKEFFKFDFDVFSHTWWDGESDGTNFQTQSDAVNNNWMIEVYENLNVVKLLVEKQKQFNVPKNFKERVIKFANPDMICSQLYSVHTCNKLKKNYEDENNFKYDYVIRTRYDFGVSVPINIEDFNRDIIYAPNDNSHAYGFNDQFAIGSSENMDIYSNVFPNIESIIDSHRDGIYTAHYCNKPDNVGTETILQRHINNNNVKFKLLDFKNFLFRIKNQRSRIHSIEG
tara:strand:+ start:812 stop:1552 length:741 start_codon:yes stop_codon:yes gene_type:complete